MLNPGEFMSQVNTDTFRAETLTPQQVLDFWFDDKKTADENIHFWFSGGKEADQAISRKFKPSVEHAIADGFIDWSKTAEGCLALVILLDQFPLNIYRGQKKSFETIRKALPIATKALVQQFDKNMTTYQKLFLYLPFEHAEDIEMQKRSVDLFKALSANANSDDNKHAQFFEKFAVDHFAVIERFGRFPTWNKVLERSNTPAEDKYLAEGGSPF